MTADLLRRKNVTLVEDDLFVPNPRFLGQFDFIRAANILNKAYFSDDQLKLGLGNLTSYLKPNGMLLITRTTDVDRNKATLLSLDGQGKFQAVFSHNGGAEAAALVPDCVAG